MRRSPKSGVMICRALFPETSGRSCTKSLPRETGKPPLCSLPKTLACTAGRPRAIPRPSLPELTPPPTGNQAYSEANPTTTMTGNKRRKSRQPLRREAVRSGRDAAIVAVALVNGHSRVVRPLLQQEAQGDQRVPEQHGADRQDPPHLWQAASSDIQHRAIGAKRRSADTRLAKTMLLRHGNPSAAKFESRRAQQAYEQSANSTSKTAQLDRDHSGREAHAPAA